MLYAGAICYAVGLETTPEHILSGGSFSAWEPKLCSSFVSFHVFVFF
jgi:hypothetical protein